MHDMNSNSTTVFSGGCISLKTYHDAEAYILYKTYKRNKDISLNIVSYWFNVGKKQ